MVISSTLQAQIIHSVFQADTLYVTGSHLFSDIVDSIRTSFLLKQEEISSLPGNSISDLLHSIGCLDVQTRGVDGIQTDFGIRGSSFEQVIVMVDNIRINDPQTGHHNSDIPVPISEIKQIEILPGHASSLYGPDGFGGVINIITKSNIFKNSIYLRTAIGSFGRKALSAFQSYNSKLFSVRISMERKKSDGYRPVTDYNTTTASFNSVLNLGKKRVAFNTGYIGKDFGANGFYADFPSREKIKSLHTRVKFDLQVNPSFFISSVIFGKYHKDDFILDYNKPQWYSSKHTTTVAGARIQANYVFNKRKEITMGVESYHERIQSSSIGNHTKKRFGIFSEVVFPFNFKTSINSGIRADIQEKWSVIVSPSFGFNYTFTPKITGRMSMGTIYRAPTFTELYYLSPANHGDPDLASETGYSLETGSSIVYTRGKIEITLFRRDEKNRIDWIKKKNSDPWQVTNIGKMLITGLSVFTEYNYNKSVKTKLNYTFINKNLTSNTDYISKYNFSILRHNLTLQTHIKWYNKLYQTIIWNLKQRMDNEPYSILSSKIIFSWGNFKFFTEASNLTNTFYEEIPNIPMPEFSLLCGLEYFL